VPSVHVTDLLAFAALAAAFFAAAVAFASTPPCPEHAPRPVALDVVPSVHTLAVAACAEAEFEIAQSAASAAVDRSKRMCIGGLRREMNENRRNTIR
jgi:hypothetical protein